jgi:hypothetical protein
MTVYKYLLSEIILSYFFVFAIKWLSAVLFPELFVF